MSDWPGETLHTIGAQDCGRDGRMDEAPLVVLLQRSRAAYWSCLGAPASDHPYRVWDLRVKFLRAMRSGEGLLVRPQCEEIGQRTLRLRFLVFDASTDAFVAEASSMVVVIDAQGRDRDVPSDVRAAAAALEGRTFEIPG